MNRTVNYHHLNYFRAIAVEGGIARASKVLRVSQSALSTQLKTLEGMLGGALFHRRNRKLLLTDFGKSVLSYANEISRLGTEMMEMAQDRISPERSHIHIGVTHGVPKKHVLALVRRALGAGECSVTITDGSPEFLTKELLDHKIDLILSNMALGSGLQTRIYSLLIERPRIVFCGVRKFRTSRESIPNFLHNKPLILPTVRQRCRHELDLYFELQQVQVNIIAETDDTAIQKGLALNGVGIIAVPEPTVRSFIESGKLVKFGYAENIFGEVWLHTVSRKVENPIASRVMRSAATGAARKGILGRRSTS